MSNQGTYMTERPKLAGEMDLDLAGDFETMHKRAFRTAFDFLHACFPPCWEQEYWDSVIAKFKKSVEEDPQNILATGLLSSVVYYLNDIVKDIPKEET